MKIKRIILLSLNCLFWLESAYSFAPTNFFEANDPFLLPKHMEAGNLNLSVHVEAGRSSCGRDACGNHTNILRIYNEHESVLPMLRNPTPEVVAQDTINLLSKLRRLPGGSVIGLTRGVVEFKGTLEQLDVGLHIAYGWQSCRIPGEFFISVHQPFTTKRITNFCITDLTPSNYCADIKVQDFIKNLSEKTKTIGDLCLGNWRKSGAGDTIAQLEWRKRFNDIRNESNNTIIKSVMLYAKLGVLFPLGERKDPDVAMSMPLGHDGHWGIPAGLGLEIDFAKYVRVGIYTDFLTLLERSACGTRLKSHDQQTNFLLLNKGFATKDPGFTWQFEGFIEAYENCHGLSAKFMYQLVSHLNDQLCISCPTTDFFDVNVINTAENLKEWNVHNLIFSIGQEYSGVYTKPQVSLFYKLPIAGKRVIDNHTFGAQLHLTF